MGYPTDRIQLFDHDMNPLHEIVPSELTSRVLKEEINGEHSLTIETSRRLEVGWRALTVDGMGKWREWVVEETDELHESGLCATGTYRLVWSLQYDMSHTYDDSGDLGHAEVGIASDGDAFMALTLAIRGSKRWTVGPCDAAPIAAGKGVVMIAESAWDRISKVVTAWGGELDAIIEVGLFGVTARKVVLMSHLGNAEPTRRFEWGDDLTSIDRVPDPGPYFCRVVPIGKGETEYAEGTGAAEDDEISFEWPLSLLDDPEYFPYEVEWIQDDEAAEAFRISDGNGGWEYPTKIVKYDKDDVELLYNDAVADLHNHTRPNVTYTAEVAQFARAGMDIKGVALGDEVQCIDRGFNPDVGLAIQERVTAIEIDELNDYATTLTIGDSIQTLTSIISDITAKADEAESVLTYYSTKKYLNDLLDRLNEELNVTGGYSYLVPGHGIFTYDAAVSDPLVGSEATQVVQIVGGGIRIANSRKSNGEWDWRSVFLSGHIAADLVTAAQITTGYIGSAASGNYWNLDTGDFSMGGDTSINMGDGTSTTIGSLVGSSITSVDVQYAESTSNTTAPTTGWQTSCPTWREGYYIWTKTVTTTTAGSSESYPVCISGRDGVSFNNATLMIYKRSASAPSAPSNNLVYSFDGGSLTGNMSGWSMTIPSGNEPCWATTAVASSHSDTDTILPSEWATPALTFQVGENGINTAVVTLYQRSPTKPSKPSGSFTYTFATGEIGGSIGSWSKVMPDGTETCWATAVTCAASTASDTFNGSEFSEPVVLVKNGLNSATVCLYKRAASQPSSISSEFTYTFSTNTLSGPLNGWSTSVPDGSNPCWMVTATALSTSDTDTISSTEWSEPIKFVENGLNTMTVYLYKRSTTQPTGNSSHPSSTLTYTFATNTLSPSPDNGWSLTIPSGSDTIWVIGSTALSTASTDTIAPSEWTTPTQLSGDKGVGVSEVIEQYCLIADGSSPSSSTSWSTAQPTWSNGYSIWTRSKITWTDNNITYTTPVLASAINGANQGVYNLDHALNSEGVFNRLMDNGRYQGLKRDPQTGEVYINATYINSGYLGNLASGNYWNLETGDIRLTTSTSVGDTTLGGIISGVDVDVEFVQSTSTSAPDTGWSTTIPTWSSSMQTWYRVRTITGTGASANAAYARDAEHLISVDNSEFTSIVKQYYLSTSSSNVTGGSWSDAKPVWSEGKSIWARLRVTFRSGSTSTTSPTRMKVISKAEAAVQALDEDLDQDGIFNRLTNNGAWQGIFTDPNTGNYYFNATYINAGTLNADLIKGGTLKLGGVSNGNGVLQVYDSSGNVIGTWNNTGLTASGELTMVTDGGFSSSAKSYANIGKMHWNGWIFGTLTSGDRYGVRLHTVGESLDGDMLITSKASIGYGSNYGASAILSQGSLCISAAAGEIGDNPHMWFGSDTNAGKDQIMLTSGVSGSWPHTVYIDSDGITLRGRANYLLSAKATDSLGLSGEVKVGVSFVAKGSKSRLATTESYGDRLLYCYETAQPMFGDIGSGVIDEDGTCYVEIDDILSETVRCDLTYHVFLQAYGNGVVWVSERTSTYFVVCGPPGLEFAWELKAMQIDYEHTRLENHDVIDWEGEENSYGLNADSIYSSELGYVYEMESLYY